MPFINKQGGCIFSFQVCPCPRAIFCHSALAGPRGCGRKESWLPGAAVPLLSVQITHVTPQSLRWAPTNSSHWRAMPGALWDVQQGAGPSLWQAAPASGCHRPGAGCLQNRHRQPPQPLCTSGSSPRSSILQPELSIPPTQRTRVTPLQRARPSFPWHGSPSGDVEPEPQLLLLDAHPPPRLCSQVFASRSLPNPGLHLRKGFCYLDHGWHSLVVLKSTGGKVWQF